MKANPIRIFFIWFVMILLFSHISLAKETSIEEDLIDRNKSLSRRFDDLASEIDRMLSSRRATTKNETTVSLIGYSESRETQKFRQTGHIDVDLRLPSLEKEWSLKVSSYDREDEFEGLGRNRSDGRPAEQKYGTSLSFARTFSNIETTFRPRLELKDPLVSSFLLKFRHSLPLKYFTIKSQLKLFAHSIDGTGESLAFDFEKAFGNNWVFRIFNEQQYLDKFNLMSVSQGPTLLKKLSDTIAISQTFVFNSNSRTVSERLTTYQTDAYHLTDYRYVFTFSHKLYNRVFHYHLSPSLTFAKSRHFKGEAGIVLKTELIF